jgi:hypothetical protein
MAVRGNVRISDLENIESISDNDIFPVSEHIGTAYETKSVTASEISDYIDNKFGIQDNSFEISYITRDLGQYVTNNNETVNIINVSVDKKGHIMIAGEQGNDGKIIFEISQAYDIYAPIDVKAGTLYIVHCGVKLADNVAVFSKVRTVNGNTYYETLPHHYSVNGLDNNNNALYLADEDCKIVICAPRAPRDGSIKPTVLSYIYSVNYAAIVETADRYIGANTETSRTIAEALASLSARIESCEKNICTIQDAVVNELDALNMYKYRGGELIVTDKVDDVTKVMSNHIGQIIINNEDVAYIATAAGSTSSWKQITN